VFLLILITLRRSLLESVGKYTNPFVFDK